MGSVEALPILCVVSSRVVVVERERRDVNRYHAEIASDHAYDDLDGASRTRSELVECSSAYKDKELGA